MDADVRAAVVARARERCERCGGVGEHVHHRCPKSRGGPDDLVNLRFLCQACHTHTHAYPEVARLEGWTVAGSITRGRYTGPSAEYQAAYPEQP